MTAGWDPVDGPLPPHNVQAISAFWPGMIDVRWDDPSILTGNTAYSIVGVNVYRSDVSDKGPFHLLNPYPLGGTFWRDFTDNQQITEVVRWDTSWYQRGDASNSRRWMLRTQHPIVKNPVQAPYQRPTPANSPTDVTVSIDGQVVPVDDVFGPRGEVTLTNQPWIDPVTEQTVPPVLPTESSEVLITYWTNRNHVRSGLDAKLWYRITTVALDDTTPSGLIETELKFTMPVTQMNSETLDYIWREAIRRNNWILEQGGERVKVFLRKQSGIQCPCQFEQRSRTYSKQPDSRCLICYGTGFCGGYEGPYEIIVCGEEPERRIAQTDRGRKLENAYEVWFGPSPMLTQRDFIVKQTNERYSVGPVRRPQVRGVSLQQHFQIGYFDESDIRYKVPVTGITELPWPQTRQERDPTVPFPIIGTQYAPAEVGVHKATQMETEKDNIPDEREQRGRTPVWVNINY